MKKLLPFLKIIPFIVAIAAFIVVIQPNVANAQSPSPSSTPDAAWYKDQEVTFVGKTATRANEFLEWALSVENYRWITLPQDSNENPIQGFWITVSNIVYAVLALFVLGAAFVMIVTRGQNLTIVRFIPRFMMIVLFVVLSFAVIQFLYQVADVIQGFFLNIKDPETNLNRNISPEDLLWVDFGYEDFIGLRKVGIEYDESAFISLLLVKLTAITYYAMTGLLLIRKIILWFFIIVSPIFPLLLFFRPVRNTAKIWVGEFFRWLLYAPLFALFLHGLVNVWRSGIPMSFPNLPQPGQTATQVYPTAISILLGGPGQEISEFNSVNLNDTFALYVVALLMLWVVILLPFLLLQVFLDYLNNASIGENPIVKKIANNTWFNKAYGGTPPPTPPGQPPVQPAPFGLAKSLPIFNKRSMNMTSSKVSSMNESSNVSSNIASSKYSNNINNINTNNYSQNTTNNIRGTQQTKEVLKLANLSIPSMRDVARYETSLLKKDTTSRTEVNKFHETLEKISKPTIAAAPHDREKFTTIKEQLISSQKQGDPLATSILDATKASTKSTQVVKENTTTTVRNTMTNLSSIDTVTSTEEKTRINKIHEQLIEEKTKGSSFASTILENVEKLKDTTITENEKKTIIEQSMDVLHQESKKGNVLATSIMTAPATQTSGQVNLPVANKIQQVSIEEYEDVKKMWIENYQKMDTPIGPSGTPIDKTTFIQQDSENITETINLLSSSDQANVDRGMERVANILPFLLLGGFSKTEVISYLKAKLEAGKLVLSGTAEKKDEEDTLLDRKPVEKAGHAQMAMSQELPSEEPKKDQQLKELGEDEKTPQGEGNPPSGKPF